MDGKEQERRPIPHRVLDRRFTMKMGGKDCACDGPNYGVTGPTIEIQDQRSPLSGHQSVFWDLGGNLKHNRRLHSQVTHSSARV